MEVKAAVKAFHDGTDHPLLDSLRDECLAIEAEMEAADAASTPEPGACGDPTCPVLHADPANPIHPCPVCWGEGCEEGCGRRGGCEMAYVGPDSHRICGHCHGSGEAPPAGSAAPVVSPPPHPWPEVSKGTRLTGEFEVNEAGNG